MQTLFIKAWVRCHWQKGPRKDGFCRCEGSGNAFSISIRTDGVRKSTLSVAKSATLQQALHILNSFQRFSSSKINDPLVTIEEIARKRFPSLLPTSKIVFSLQYCTAKYIVLHIKLS
jgi:hypothetical protein